MNGSCSFIIRDESLDFDDITRRLATIPTSIHKKGEAVRKGGETKSLFDIWRFEALISEQVEPEEALESLLNKLTPYFKEINELIGIYENVGIDCYLRSDYGQLGLQLSTDIMRKIVLLGVGFNIHILSFGGVEKDDKHE